MHYIRLGSATVLMSLFAITPSWTAAEENTASNSAAVAPAEPNGTAVREGDIAGKGLPETKASQGLVDEIKPITLTRPKLIPITPAPPRKDEQLTAFEEAVLLSPDRDADSAIAHRELSAELEALRNKVRRALTAYYPRKLNSREHNCWEMMHALIGYGMHTEIYRGGSLGDPVNAAQWLCQNGTCNTQRLLYVENNRIQAKQGVGVQGHFGQFLAILAQSRIGLSYSMRVDGQDFTVADLLESEKLGCQTNMELTFKLIAIAHYSETLDETWKNSLGQDWSVSRLLKEEIAAPIRGAACGGTHRLMGLAYAVRKRELLEEPIEGEFKRARKYLDDYHRYTLALQNSDGSFSTEWFRGPGARNDIDRRLQTTGHILEWLAFSLPYEELSQPKVVKAVNYLASIMLNDPSRGWEIGPTGHAIHALMIYEERMFQGGDPLRFARANDSEQARK